MKGRRKQPVDWLAAGQTPPPQRPGVDPERVLLALRASEQRYRAVFETTTAGVVEVTLDAHIIRANAAFCRMLGYTEAEIAGMPVANLVPPADREAMLAQYQRLVTERAPAFESERQYLRKDGGTMWAAVSAVVVRMDGEADDWVCGVVIDLTERRKLETQLHHAQKMEAVGQLAGGVAHDFNNLLTVINGYAELLMAGLSPADPAWTNLTAIRDAGDRASSLTSQLLAFSRKAVVERRTLDLNEVIGQSERLLRRLIGEDVVLTTAPAHSLHRIKADPTQIEQIVMNLAVNARDAMPRGGRLTIETRNVHLREPDAGYPDLPAGRYVQLAVSDTGVGMTEEVKVRIFEPFFTTKEAGRGTGLGLAMVYGAVKAHRGHIGVYSEPGVGTVFKILLPATRAEAAAKSSVLQLAPRGIETILLVEDEDGVRNLAGMALRMYGYTVLEASNGADGLALADAHPAAVHLLVTDVVMPRMSGREVAEAIRKRHPGIKVLYASGYTDDAVVRHGVIEATDAFLQKPFTPMNLARKVRFVLDAER